MNKTRVDDMLIEMIEPKIQEINKKFTNGESLTQDDINTLLLKSQYNHINHLDEKLNEVTQAVINLEHKFEILETNYKSDFKTLSQQYKSDFANLSQQYKSDFKNLEEKIETTIQKALNKNMMMLIMVLGFFLTLSKLIDKMF